MFFVLMLHINLKVILRNNDTSQVLNYFALLSNSLVFVCINTFVMISGYFSVQVKIKSFLSLLIQTEFYGALALLVYFLISFCCGSFSVSINILGVLMPFHPTGLWFIPCYVLLLVISPLLNWICKDKKAHALSILIIALGAGVVYITRGNNGCNIVNFMLIYLIGRLIALYARENSLKQKNIAAFLLFLSVGFTFCLELWWLNRGHGVADKTIFSHCTPWLITSSVALFVLFKNITITKRWLFFVGPSVLSVYLFHGNYLIEQYIYIKPLRFLISISPNDALSYIILIIYGLSLFSIIVLFDHFVRIPIQDYIMGNLKNNRVYKVMDSKLQKLNK